MIARNLFNPEPAATAVGRAVKVSSLGEFCILAVMKVVKSAVAAGSGLNESLRIIS